MTGNMEYEYQYQKRIDDLLLKNPKLIGFYSFINEKSISTIYNYLLIINNFLTNVDKNINELNVDDFSLFLLKKQKNICGEKTTSSYKIDVYSALKKYGNYLVASNQLQVNPVNYIDRPKAIESQKTINKRENGFLSKEEIPQYIHNVNVGAGSLISKSRQKEWKERDMAIVQLFLNTGIRCSALMKIDLDDINFQTKTLSVTEKGSKAKTYTLSDELINIINSWLLKRKIILNGIESSALFISNQRTRMVQSSISRIVKKYADGINGKHITPHKLRATYGTQLYDHTNDIYFVQKCMNHSNPKTTELYIRGGDNQTEKASEIMQLLTM